MISSIEELKDYKFYFIQYAPVAEQRIVAFYQHYPGDSPDESTFDPSYHFSFEGENGENLMLYFRYCFEGCHLGLSRIE